MLRDDRSQGERRPAPARNVLGVLQGRPPDVRNCVNPEVLTTNPN